MVYLYFVYTSAIFGVDFRIYTEQGARAADVRPDERGAPLPPFVGPDSNPTVYDRVDDRFAATL